MKILYDDKTGQVYYRVPDKDWFYFEHKVNIPLTEMDVLETVSNQALCIELHRKGHLKNDIGQHKYYVETGVIVERPDWQPAEFDTDTVG